MRLKFYIFLLEQLFSLYIHVSFNVEKMFRKHALIIFIKYSSNLVHHHSNSMKPYKNG